MPQVSFAAVLLLLSARAAVACSCIGSGTVEQALQRADVVFAGVVESVDDPAAERRQQMSEEERHAALVNAVPLEWGPDYGLRIRIRVLQWWKSDTTTPDHVEVWTGYSGADCRYFVQRALSYLVYAHRAKNGNLITALCDRNALLACGLQDIAQLGAPIELYEKVTPEQLIAREQPYDPTFRSCLTPALLISERGVVMPRDCRLGVNAVIGTDGRFSKFEIPRPIPNTCAAGVVAQIAEHAPHWRFRAATIDGTPVAVRLNAISPLEPMSEAEYQRFISNMKRR